MIRGWSLLLAAATMCSATLASAEMIDLSSKLNADAVYNTGDTSQSGIDGEYSFGTQAVAPGGSATNPNGLPNSGYYYVSDSNNGNNVIQLASGGASVTGIGVAQGYYSNLVIDATAGSGDNSNNSLTITYHFADSTTSDFSMVVNDWYTSNGSNVITTPSGGSATYASYNGQTFDQLIRFRNNGTSTNGAASFAIFRYTIPVPTAKMLTGIDLTYIHSPGPLVNIFGIQATAVPEPSSLAMLACGLVGGAYLLRRRRAA